MIDIPDKSDTVGRLGELLRHLECGKFLIDSFGVIRRVDRIGATQLGTERSSLLATSFSRHLAWEDRALFSGHLQRTLEKKDQLLYCRRLIKLNGKVFESFIKGIWVKDKEEAVDLCRITVHDISFVTRIETMLSREKDLNRSLINNSIDGIVSFDIVYRITEWNHVLEKMTGINQKACVGKNVFHVIPYLKKIGEDRYFEAALQGRRVSSKNRHYRMAGTDREGFFEAHYSPVRDESGNVKGGIAFIRDITDWKQKEEELLEAKKLEAVASLAPKIAHNYNNLFADIMGNISLAKLYLERGDKPYELIDAASKIVLRARELTRHLTLLSCGQMPVRKKVDLGSLLTDMVEVLLSASGAAFQYNHHDDLWHAEVDEGQLWQAIQMTLTYMNEFFVQEMSCFNFIAENAIVAGNSGLPLLNGKYVFICISCN